MLEVKNLSVSYGAIEAVKDISFTVNDGEIVSLIGANGAGKSTTLKAISGLMKLGPEAKITFDGEDITHLPPHEIAARGIAHVPEGRGIFAENTVLENLRMGAYLSRSKARTQELLETSLDLFPRLRERLRQQAGTLSGGEQQMLTMARGLMMEPKLMLLDEPSMGLAPVIVEQIFEIIADLHRRGITILLISSELPELLMLSDRIVVMSMGKISGIVEPQDYSEENIMMHATGQKKSNLSERLKK